MWKLRELSLVDFKSFSGTHVFGPFNGFHLSCVVGLNGSGKSNIVDALSFVLGGGSKSLRSERFAELCHRDRVSGQATGRRAQVFATFVNSSSKSELVFKRVVNPDSSTSFSLNSKSVDRKAYVKALSDISAYSKGCIVAQGYIESISLSSAQEKGQLLDRLSGSAAFKDEYDSKSKRAVEISTELKVVSSKKDDVEHSLRNMKKQHADLKRYKAVRARLRRAQAVLATLQNKELTWTSARAKSRCEVIERELQNSKKKIKQKQDFVQENLTQQQIISTDIRNIKLEITKIQRQAVAKEEAQAKLVEARDELKIQVELATEALECAKKECTEIKKDYKGVMTTLNEKLNKLDVKKKAVTETLESHPYTNIPESAKKKAAALAQQSGQEFRIHELNDEVQLAADRLASAAAYLESTRERKEVYTQKVAETMREIELANEELQRLEREVREKTALLEKRRALDSEITQVQNTVKALNDQVHGGNDVSEKNTHVCAHLQRHQTVYGRIADLLTVTDPHHITAISTALGRQRNMIVVETYEDAVECIKILKAKRWGIEEFIPLQGQRGMENASTLKRLRQHSDLFRPAVDCITTNEERFMPAIASILGDTVIIEGSLDRARDIAYRESKTFPALRIVTSDGQKIAKNGNITLGNTLDRKRPANASALENKLQEAKMCLQRLIEERSAALEQPADDAAVEVLREQAVTKKNALTRLKAKLDEFGLIVSTCDKEYHLADLARQKCASEVESLNHERTRVVSSQISLDEEDKRLSTLYHEVTELNSEIASIDAEDAKATREAVNALLAVMRRLGEDNNYRLNGSGAWKREISYLSKEIEGQLKSRKLVEKADAELKALMQKRSELESASASVVTAQEEVEMETRLRNQQGELEEDLKNAKELSRQASNAVRELLTEKHRLERELFEENTRWRESVAKLAALQESAMVVVPSSADGEVDNLPDEQIEMPALDDGHGERYFRRQREKWEVDIADCNEEIRSMSLINHQAETMLEEIKAKLSVILDEYDARKSAKHLIDLDLAELRETRRKMFLKCYNAVNKYLDEIYLTLTRVDAETFGSASIELEDEISAEPFAKGVIFHAIPPGKRYTDLDSLSGGEKAMAALALLFACQRYNQAPFIVLDEVDAPLDLENLMALRDYLHKTPFQVFMITLKEEIYSAADAIIGVYKSPNDHNSHTITVSLLDFATNEKLSCDDPQVAASALTSS